MWIEGSTDFQHYSAGHLMHCLFIFRKWWYSLFNIWVGKCFPYLMKQLLSCLHSSRIFRMHNVENFHMLHIGWTWECVTLIFPICRPSWRFLISLLKVIHIIKNIIILVYYIMDRTVNTSDKRGKKQTYHNAQSSICMKNQKEVLKNIKENCWYDYIW